MFNDKGVLSDRARGILFWFTIAMILLVAVIAVITILRACSGIVTQVESPLAVSPTEANLCPGEQQGFVVIGDVGVTWEATGGVIGENGLFTAGDAPGDYTVTATEAGGRQKAEAAVHVVACTPTPAPTPSPTPVPTATPIPQAATPAAADPQGDVGAYENGAPVAGVPSGLDVSDASIAPDLRVALQPTEGAPAELAGLAIEGDVLLWIALYDPIPEPPTAYTDWLFALDVDGNTATGRPAGTARINPDLGDDAVIGLNYDPAVGAYEPYLLVWNTAQGGWQNVANGVRAYKISDSRLVVGLAVPLQALTQSLSGASGVTVAFDVVKGRAAAVSYVGEQKVIDFYPNLP